MKKRLLAGLLALFLLLSGCSAAEGQDRPRQYTDYTLFDTVTVILGYGKTREEFETRAKEICRELQDFHRLFDIYHSYEGLVNLRTVNDRAGREEVQVDPLLMDFLLDCRQAYDLTGGRVNIAMGPVLKLWHDAREKAMEDPENAALPDRQALEVAAEHCSIEDLILDSSENTVRFRDPEMRLDVGALAKGWAAERISGHMPEGWLISLGGNVRATGPKPGGEPWVVGIQDPDGGEGYLASAELDRGSAVTSGDYQRYFQVGDRMYHHIIDPDTLEPGTLWRSVTVICTDSGLADCLSTALFLLPLEDGKALAEKTGAEVLWMDPGGEIHSTEGFPIHR